MEVASNKLCGICRSDVDGCGRSVGVAMSVLGEESALGVTSGGA